MKILYLAHRIPFPPNKGDKIRSFHQIEYLSRRHEVFLICLVDRPEDLQYESDLKRWCRKTIVVRMDPFWSRVRALPALFTGHPLSVPYFHLKAAQRACDDLMAAVDFDAVFCFSSPMAEYVFRSPMSLRGIVDPMKKRSKTAPKLIMDFVDVDSDKWAQFAQYASPLKQWVYRMESRRLAAYEKKVAQTFHCSIFVTGAEERVFKNQNPEFLHTAVIPNGVDLEYFSPRFQQQKSAEQPALVFTGAMDYFANIDGVKWFVSEIWPLVKRGIPAAQFFIVGSNPAREVLELAGGGVTVTGTVPDTREYLGRASAVVVPLRIARGIQNKILEAMSMGIPVITTPQAFEGIEAEPGRDLALGENKERFAAEVIDLLKTEDRRRFLAENARRNVEEKYCWDKNLKQLEKILETPPGWPIPAAGGRM